jgi:hypothetical protein
VSYDPNSKEVAVGEEGNDRALDLMRQRLEERGSTIVVRRGPKHSRANGIKGDLLFSRPDEAPLLTIEVKTSFAKYPDSVSVSVFEFNNSQARWLMAMNEDHSLGCWFQEWGTAMAHTVERVGHRNGRQERYYTTEPPIKSRIPLAVVLDAIQREFGEIE